MIERIKNIVQDSIYLKKDLLANPILLNTINDVIREMIFVFQNNGKVLMCGNGGSAADAQHLAAELSNRFFKNRKSLFAEALHVNTSYLTAAANDFSYEEIYSRLLEGKADEKDMLWAFSTSGKSPNVLRALEMGKKIGLKNVGFTGTENVDFVSLCDICISIPDANTPRVQEMHMLIGHIICELVEDSLFPND